MTDAATEPAPAKPKLAAYVRVSTTNQEVASQRRSIERWLKMQGFNPQTDCRWFDDHGKSGASLANRAGLSRLQAAIEAGEVDTVVMQALDRLCRTMIEGLVEIDRWLEAGVKIVLLSDGLTLGKQSMLGEAMMKCLVAFRLAFAQAERERIVQRVHAGQAVVRAKVKAMRDLYDHQKLTVPEIARRYGVKDADVQRVLTNRNRNVWWKAGEGSKGTFRKGKPKVFYERWLQKFSFRQIARSYGVAVDTVRRSVHDYRATRPRDEWIHRLPTGLLRDGRDDDDDPIPTEEETETESDAVVETNMETANDADQTVETCAPGDAGRDS